MALTKADAKQVAIARSQLATNPGFYARSIAAIQRCAKRPQDVIDVIREDGTFCLFETRNGCLIAAEGI